MAKKKYTKWRPLGNFTYDDTDYVVFVKKNLKNGLLKFKHRSVNKRPLNMNNSILPTTLIDTAKAWEEVINERE